MGEVHIHLNDREILAAKVGILLYESIKQSKRDPQNGCGRITAEADIDDDILKMVLDICNGIELDFLHIDKLEGGAE